MYIALNEIIESRHAKYKNGKQEQLIDQKVFKARMSIFMVLRLVFTIICTVLTAIFFREPVSRHNSNGPPKPILQ